jgi:hypothetical protein
MPVMMYTHAHVFTPEYWNACVEAEIEVIGWRELLAKYRANLIVIETNTHQEFAADVRADPDWVTVQDGPQGNSATGILIALRKKPL